MLGKVGPARVSELDDACGRFHTLLHWRLPTRELIISSGGLVGALRNGARPELERGC